MEYLNLTGLNRVYQHIVGLLNGKVSRVEGKDLSTNDYTDAEKTKLFSIEEGANKSTAITTAEIDEICVDFTLDEASVVLTEIDEVIGG